MYAIIVGYFVYLFYINFQYPYLVNYIFIFFGIILSSLYQSYRAIVLSGSLSLILLLYFFTYHFDTIFFQVDSFDIAYFILFAVLMVIFFIYQIRFMNSLWRQVEEKQKSTDHKLHSTQEHLHSFFNQTAEAIIVGDLNGKVLDINPAFENLYGWKKAEVVGQPIPIIPKEFVSEANQRWKQVLSGEVIQSLETKHVCKNGSIKNVEVSISPIKDMEGKIVALTGILRDVTEKKITEEKLVNTEKLSTLGQIAAGLAHEIRNPLAVISGYIQIIGKDNERNSRYSKVMLSELNRIDLIISELLFLGKPQAVHFQRIDIRNIIKEVTILFESQLQQQGVQCVTEFQGEIPDCYLDPNQLKQVFVNTIKNAIEAMPSNGGTISIQVSPITHDELIISIKDTGVGIPEKVLEKIGNPFFTTKEEGTGLGLLVTKQIIESHNGQLNIKSEENKGTTIEILLPTID